MKIWRSLGLPSISTPSVGGVANNNHILMLDCYNKGSNQVHILEPISDSY